MQRCLTADGTPPIHSAGILLFERSAWLYELKHVAKEALRLTLALFYEPLDHNICGGSLTLILHNTNLTQLGICKTLKRFGEINRIHWIQRYRMGEKPDPLTVRNCSEGDFGC